MDTIMSACGVQCSECGAYRAASKGLPYQQEDADAWRRIYGGMRRQRAFHVAGVWDGVPQIGATLSPEDFDRYVRPYCGHRERLAKKSEEEQGV